MSSEHKRNGWRTWGAAVILAVFYVLSYPIALRLCYGSNEQWRTGDLRYVHMAVYRPVEWLIDETPVYEPMMQWARVWDVDSIVPNGKYWRSYGDEWHKSHPYP